MTEGTGLSISEYDAREQEHRHKLEIKQAEEKAIVKQEIAKGEWHVAQAKYQHKEARQETLKYVGVAFAFVILFLGIATIIFLATSGPDEGAAREQEREAACVANGGGWVPEDLLVQTGQGMCVYPGERAK